MMRTTVCAADFVRRAVRALLLAAAVVVPVSGIASSAAAADPTPVLKYPEPSPFPISWELKFKHTAPKRIVVQLANQKYATAYWYITYTAINRGDKEAPFEPEFDLLAENGKTYRGNLAIPDVVFQEIRKREGNNLLELPRKVIGTINPGEDQAKDSIAVWQEPARKMGTFSIFVAGLSGESLTMKKVADQYVPVDPKLAADQLKGVKEEDRLLLRKQLQLTYEVIGDEGNVGKDPIFKRNEIWVMR
jgi:hypothetical protein